MIDLVDVAALRLELQKALEPVEARVAALAAEVRSLREELCSRREPEPARIYLSPAEAAQRWGVSQRHVRELLRAGLPALRVGRRVRIDVLAAEAWLTQRKARAHLRVVGGTR